MKPLLTLSLLLSSIVIAGTWTKNPFDQKVFIKNVGQFNDKSQSTIFFGTSVDGVELYFTSSGLTYRHDETAPMTEEERDEFKEPGAEREEERRMMKTVTHSLSTEWVGANPDAKIITEDSISSYYTYAAEPQTLLAHAFKKIIYKNLYQNIDVEYIFPERKQGIKYSVIVHPGGDVSQIKIRYTGAENLSRDNEGNIIIKSTFGDFTDHAPISTSAKSNKAGESAVQTDFVVKGDEVSFDVGAYDHTRELIIDPWITNPNFGNYNSAYDVNYDINGNVYIYGSFSHFKLSKYDSTGILRWTFSPPTDFGNQFYGDFAVDGENETCYIAEGYHFPSARVCKVNSQGIQTGTFTGYPNWNEMWRVEYNRCINKIVIAGGGTSGTYQAAMLDTNLASITPVNVLSASSGYHDMALLTVDGINNFCYMATVKTANNDFDNLLLKCPIPDLVPPAFSIYDGYKLFEGYSITYVYNNKNGTVGMNGMAVSPCWLYTYDSDVLKRWNKNSGTFSGAVHVSPQPPEYYYNGQQWSAIQVYWGGLSVDDNDNIYIGVVNQIKEYDASLSIINTFPLPDHVYDVKIGPNNKLYACGNGFVTQLDAQDFVSCDSGHSQCDSIRSFCDLVGVSSRDYFDGSIGHCCSEFTLSNLYQAGLVYSISAKLLTEGVKIDTARGPWSPGPSYNDSTIIWSIPPPGLQLGGRDSLSACFTRSSAGTIQVEFTFYDAAGSALCVDTLTLCSTSGMNDDEKQNTNDVILGESYPHPATSVVTIAFTIPKIEKVTLQVTDILGREVLRLVDGEMMKAGHHAITADMSSLRSGVYCYSLCTEKRRVSKLMRIVR